jgi:hypothetical protein
MCQEGEEEAVEGYLMYYSCTFVDMLREIVKNSLTCGMEDEIRIRELRIL